MPPLNSAPSAARESDFLQGLHPCTPPEPFFQKGFRPPKNLQKKNILFDALQIPKSFSIKHVHV
jgi:hypothetical protein